MIELGCNKKFVKSLVLFIIGIELIKQQNYEQER